MWNRLKNLWQLSRFKITEFDNKLVITEKDGELVFARPKESQVKKAQIIKKEVDPLDEIINGY